MKVTYNWLKDFVDIKIPARALADKLTMAGLEVVSLEERSGDFIFEIEITSNRPDWLSVIGIAREVAAITGAKLKNQNTKRKFKTKNTDNLRIEIEEKKDCSLYTGRIIKNVLVGPSPEWLKNRLELLGCRSVNNIVDLTNYLLFELGEPLHAFDFDKCNFGRVIVRRAKKSEQLITIDGEKKALDGNILVIADENKPIAIAGVIGGKDTEVTAQTKNILLEAAVFNPVVVRRSRQALGIQTEASYRFERGVDALSVEIAAVRIAELISEVASGDIGLLRQNKKPKIRTHNIDLATDNITKILGINIPASKIRSILLSLGFKVKTKGKNGFRVSVPSFRQDVLAAEDLIEEISRIYGYEKIPQSLPEIKPFVTIRQKRDLVSGLKQILVGLGLNEAITYSLTDANILNLVGAIDQAPIAIMNPLSQEQGVLRTTLIPGLARSISHNLNQKQDYVALFEIANIFKGSEDSPKEELILGLALTGTKTILLNQGAVKDQTSILNLKGILEKLFLSFNINNYKFVNQGSGKVDIYIGENISGRLLKLSPDALVRLEIKNKDVFALELSLDDFLKAASPDKKFILLPKFPGITRDISCILKEDVSVEGMLKYLKENSPKILQSLEISDYYKGKQIPAGFRGLTLSCLYRLNDRTLTEDEVQPLHNSICEILTGQFQAKIR